MGEETILSNGIFSLIRLSGTVEGQGAGQISTHTDENVWTSSAVQVREPDGRLTELRNVSSADYLQQHYRWVDAQPGTSEERRLIRKPRIFS